jgi:hypothetical protein
MKNSEIRELLRGKIIPELGKVLIALNERLAAQHQQIMELARMLDTLATALQVQAQTVHKMQSMMPAAQAAKNLAVKVGSEEHEDVPR